MRTELARLPVPSRIASPLAMPCAIFVPPEPGRFAARAKKDAYREVVIALKRLDELKGAEREQAITEVVALLGGGLR